MQAELYNVFGNHPTLRYITKFNLSKIEKDSLVEELKMYGYEITVEDAMKGIKND